MKCNALHNNDDWLKFNPKTGWLGVSELSDNGFKRKKTGMFLDPKSIDELILSLLEYKQKCE